MRKKCGRGGPLVLVLALLAVLAVAAPAWAASPRAAAVAVVRHYLHALAAHDAPAVCGAFSPQFRRFEASWENLGPDCARRVAVAHFAPSSPGHGLTRIRIVRVTAVHTDRYGNVAVHLLLAYRSLCAAPSFGPFPGCVPKLQRHWDIVYLRSERGRLKIVKPGAIYYNSSENSEPFADPLAPPADPASIRQPAKIGPPPETCQAGGVQARGEHRHLFPATGGGRSKRVSARKAPWLLITNVRAVRLSRRQLCITITLGAKPHPDTEYLLFVEQASGEGDLDLFDLEIDGVGDLKPSLRDTGETACRTGFGLIGDRLELIVELNRYFDQKKPITVSAASQSLQSQEPLLPHPINLIDLVPQSLRGLRLPRGATDLERCRSLRRGGR